VNKLVIMGRLGQNPERKGGIVKMSVATDRYNGPDRPKSTDWHSVVVFGKTADFVMSACVKGTQVVVEGSVKYTTWEKQDGTKGYGVEIPADRVHLCGSSSTRPAEQVAVADLSDDMPF